MGCVGLLQVPNANLFPKKETTWFNSVITVVERMFMFMCTCNTCKFEGRYKKSGFLLFRELAQAVRIVHLLRIYSIHTKNAPCTSLYVCMYCHTYSTVSLNVF